jgi:class 3 adenylate cyclase
MRNEKPKRPFLRVLLSVPLRLKITIPYLIVATILASLGVYQVSRSFVLTLEERFQGQLQDASFRVADGFVEVEEKHLAAVRSIAFTEGVPEAIAEGSTATVRNLIYPQVVNNQLYDAIILNTDGKVFVSFSQSGDALLYSENQPTELSRLPSVQAVLAGEIDEIGDKYSEIVAVPGKEALYTAGPVMLNGEVVGVVLVGTPFSVLLPELAINSLSNVTIYDKNGNQVGSTFNDESLPALNEIVTTELALPSDNAPTRDLVSGSRSYVEAIDIVYLRTKPSGWFYGVSLPETLVRETGMTTLLPLIATFILGMIVLVALGLVVAQLIAIPIFRLLNASERVGAGDFETQVDVYADDEIGLLTNGFNRMVRELRKRERVREMFSRMVSRDVSEAILDGDVSLGGETRFVSVLFTDLRGYTSLSEIISPTELILLLNQFFAIVESAARKHQGSINNFGGDSVLAVFGAPVERSPDETLRQSLYAALEIRKGVVQLNAERIAKSKPPLRYGIGINSGTVIAGNIGTEDRFQYTVIGDAVNVAARLQDISRQFPRTPILIPEDGVEIVKGDEIFEFQYLGDFRLKGKGNPVSTYGVVGINTHIPADFMIFDDFPYPKTDALLACYLNCMGYSSMVISETMQVDSWIVEQWLSIARENAEIIIPILRDIFEVPEDMVLKFANNLNITAEEI